MLAGHLRLLQLALTRHIAYALERRTSMLPAEVPSTSAEL